MTEILIWDEELTPILSVQDMIELYPNQYDPFEHLHHPLVECESLYSQLEWEGHLAKLHPTQGRLPKIQSLFRMIRKRSLCYLNNSGLLKRKKANLEGREQRIGTVRMMEHGNSLNSTGSREDQSNPSPISLEDI